MMIMKQQQQQQQQQQRGNQQKFNIHTIPITAHISSFFASSSERGKGTTVNRSINNPSATQFTEPRQAPPAGAAAAAAAADARGSASSPPESRLSTLLPLPSASPPSASLVTTASIRPFATGTIATLAGAADWTHATCAGWLGAPGRAAGAGQGSCGAELRRR
jgi:hypothetical protein